MSKPLVYLVGPITGKPSSKDRDWRSYCREKLSPEIVVLSPLRQHFEVIDEAGELSCEDRLRVMQHGRSIVMRDRFDVMRCNLLIANLAGSEQISIGSVGEIFWADSYRKPVIMVREAKNVHTHAMLDALVGWIHESLDDAISTARTLLLTE